MSHIVSGQTSGMSKHLQLDVWEIYFLEICVSLLTHNSLTGRLNVGINIHSMAFSILIKGDLGSGDSDKNEEPGLVICFR